MAFTGNSLSNKVNIKESNTLAPFIIPNLNNTSTGDAIPFDFSDDDWQTFVPNNSRIRSHGNTSPLTKKKKNGYK